ncbi:MAG: type II toxin-antitoxin system VapC family toxin [Rhizobiaceae bacterium]
MIVIVDTSIWIEHLRASDPMLADMIRQRSVRLHPFVLAEIALGNPPNRSRLLTNLKGLRPAPVATEEEMLTLVESEAIFGKGLGFVDVHLLASARLEPGSSVWTRDKRLGAVARNLGLAMTSH